MTKLTIRFMFYTIYILNRHLKVPKDVGSWTLEYDLEEKWNRRMWNDDLPHR